MSYGIITSHGGTISVENNVEGCAFTVILPVKEKTEDAHEKAINSDS